MSNTEESQSPPPLEVVEAPGSDDPETETVSQPAKLMRIGSMLKQLLDEAKAAPLDEKARLRLREIYETSVKELAEGLSPDLQTELAGLAMPFAEEAPSEAELRVAQAQLVGWLEGLFHGIQATLFAQQMAARNQLEGMRGRPAIGGAPDGEPRPGQYL
ncbi:MAG: DUF2587 domain-containing protein [Acidimicrobiales bacterium]|nr:DUF2587 domain-containing protein [Acidimicrobiales bacterium]